MSDKEPAPTVTKGSSRSAVPGSFESGVCESRVERARLLLSRLRGQEAPGAAARGPVTSEEGKGSDAKQCTTKSAEDAPTRERGACDGPGSAGVDAARVTRHGRLGAEAGDGAAAAGSPGALSRNERAAVASQLYQLLGGSSAGESAEACRAAARVLVHEVGVAWLLPLLELKRDKRARSGVQVRLLDSDSDGAGDGGAPSGEAHRKATPEQAIVVHAVSLITRVASLGAEFADPLVRGRCSLVSATCGL